MCAFYVTKKVFGFYRQSAQFYKHFYFIRRFGFLVSCTISVSVSISTIQRPSPLNTHWNVTPTGFAKLMTEIFAVSDYYFTLIIDNNRTIPSPERSCVNIYIYICMWCPAYANNNHDLVVNRCAMLMCRLDKQRKVLEWEPNACGTQTHFNCRIPTIVKQSFGLFMENNNEMQEKS